MEFCPMIVFGWPSAVGGLALLVLGVLWRHPWVGAVGALVSAGFCTYIILNPMPFRLVGLIVLASNVLSVVAVRRHATGLAGALLLPFLLAAGYLAYRVFAS